MVLQRRRYFILIELIDPIARTEMIDRIKQLPISLELVPVVTSELPIHVIALLTDELGNTKEQLQNVPGIRNVDILMELTEEEVQ